MRRYRPTPAGGRDLIIRPTRATLRILTALQAASGGPMSYSTITRLAGGSPGNIHITLYKLRDAGWVEFEAERDPAPTQRGPRRLYRLTPAGRIRAAELLRQELAR
jgi:DNA-binding PadR family transcriptional regulator